MKQLVLASASPTRRDLLNLTGIKFTVDPSNYQEDMSLNLPPDKLAVYLSQGKARDVAKRHKNAVILGADSFAVAKNGELMGKPHTTERAQQMLSSLSGTRHLFITGYTILDTSSGKKFSDSVTSEVYFKKLTKKEINNYLKKEDVHNKAGAYSSQGLGAVLIEKINGSYSNVRGLPLAELADNLKAFGIHIL